MNMYEKYVLMCIYMKRNIQENVKCHHHMSVCVMEKKVKIYVENIQRIKDTLMSMLILCMENTNQLSYEEILRIKGETNSYKQMLNTYLVKMKMFLNNINEMIRDDLEKKCDIVVLKKKITNALGSIYDLVENSNLLINGVKNVVGKKITENITNDNNLEMSIKFDENNIVFKGRLTNGIINLYTKEISEINFSDMVGSFMIDNYSISHGTITIFDTKSTYVYNGIIIKLLDGNKYVISSRPIIPTKYNMNVTILLQLFIE